MSGRGRGLVALGFFLARRGATAAIALALTLASVVGFGVLAFILARHGKHASLDGVPLVASSALAYGIGVLVAFAVSTRVFRRDEDEGVRALLDARGVHASAYLGARVVGLTALLAILVAGGSAAVGLVTLLAARSREGAGHTVQATLAAIAFGLAFALVFAPVAMATLGARSRGGGYLALLSVLVVPEIVEPFFSRRIPERWLEVCSIPGALVGLRTSLAPVGVDALLLGRALVALAVILVAALAIVRLELLRAHGSTPHGRSSRPK